MDDYQTESEKKSSDLKGLFTLNDLMNADIPTREWIVDQLLYPGLFLFVGDTKVGKSIYARTLALAVALGEKLFGEFQCQKGSVVYFALEEGKEGLQLSFERMLSNREIDRNIKIDLFITTEIQIEEPMEGKMRLALKNHREST